MRANTDKEKIPAYYLITGMAFLLLGFGNITFLISPDDIYQIILGIVGIPLIIGAIYLLKQYKSIK